MIEQPGTFVLDLNRGVTASVTHVAIGRSVGHAATNVSNELLAGLVLAWQVELRFPALYFGGGFQLRARNVYYRVSLVPIHSLAGQRTMDGQAVLVGTRLSLSDLPPARAAVDTWRAVLVRTGAAVRERRF